MSRYQLVSRPQNLPGHCFLTRSDQEEWFIDTMVTNDLPWGSVYIGKSAFEEMRELVDREYPPVISDSDLNAADPSSNLPPVGSPPNSEKTLVEGEITLESLNRKLDELSATVASLFDRYLDAAKEFHPSNRRIAETEPESSESSDVEELGNVRNLKSGSQAKRDSGFFDL